MSIMLMLCSCYSTFSILAFTDIYDFACCSHVAAGVLALFGVHASTSGCRVDVSLTDVSPTDVSPTESSWMLRPLNKASLGYCVLTDVSQPWTMSSMELALSAAIVASVGLWRLMDQWGVWPASPTPLTRFIGLATLRRMHARPTHRTPPLCSAKARGSWKWGVAALNQIKGMGWFSQGQISQGTLCPRDATSKNFRSGTHWSGMD
jgi:hypothetical protein